MPLDDSREDADLVAAVLAGDRAAGDALVRRHAPPLRELIRRYASGRRGFGPDDVENVFQQAWLRLLEEGGSRLQAYDPARPFLPFLLGVGLNACRDYLKAERLRRPPAGEAPDVPALGAGPSEAAMGEEARQALRRALSALPARERLVLEWVDADGMTFREAAGLLGMPLSSCRDLVMEARRRLRRQVEGK